MRVCANAKTKLNVPEEDKMEEAWKRVLLKQGSKKQIALLCDVSERSVATMRMVAECENELGERRGSVQTQPRPR